MNGIDERRQVLRALGLGVAAAGLSGVASASAAALGPPVLEAGAADLRDLMQRLAAAPRRRDFKTVPMILTDRDQWDHEAYAEVLGYKPRWRQLWDNTAIASPWLNLMRNALNTEIWSFGHPDVLLVSATHGSANFALYDQTIWDKYRLADLAGGAFRTNTLIEEKPAAAADPSDYQNPRGVFSPADNSIPMLMRRGVVFMSCHNAIWEQAGALIAKDVNPDKLPQAALAAELNNHLIDGVVVIPGAAGTILELQESGFRYIKS